MKTLIKLMDVKTLVAGIIPVILGSVYSLYRFDLMDLGLTLLLMLAIVLLQSSTNMINDLFDYIRGTDSQKKAHEKALASGEIKVGQVKKIIASFLCIDAAVAIYLSWRYAWAVMVICLLGALVMYFYSAGKKPISHTPFGELAAGGTMGLGIMATVIYLQSGWVDVQTLLVTLPTTIYIGSILLTNNISDHKEDRVAGRQTLPITMGIRRAEYLWQISSYSLLIAAVLFFTAGYWPLESMLLSLFAFPYRSVAAFRSIPKTAHNKGKLMGMINVLGLRYHLAVTVGMLISHYT